MGNPASSEHSSEDEAAMTSAISVRRAETSSGALALASDQHDWTPEQAAALTQLGLEEATAADLKVFLHQSQRTGLDPFARQIYMIGRWDGRAGKKKFTIQSSIDGLRIVAERHGQYGGQVGPEWCGDDGVWRDVWVSKKPPTAARVGVVRKDWSQPTYAVALFSEYAATKKDGNLEPMWASKSALMIAKCAEALALRKAFPHDLSGIYTSDEMAQADNPPVRLVIDQPADNAKQVATPTTARERAASEVNWDAEITACGNDRLKLLALYKVAPDGPIRERIAELGKKLKAAAVESEPITVDAELVEEPTPARTSPRRPNKMADAKSASVYLDEMLANSDFDAAEGLAINAPRVDISGLLTSDVREILDVQAGEKIMLPEFGQIVADYISSHGYSVQSALDGDLPSEGSAA